MKTQHLLILSLCLLLVAISTQLTIKQSNLTEVLLSALAYGLIGLVAVVLFLLASILYEFASGVRRRIFEHVSYGLSPAPHVLSPAVSNTVNSNSTGITAELLTDPEIIRMIENAIA